MRNTIYLAGKYLMFHKWKAMILVVSITLILFLPVGLRILVQQSSDQLIDRASRTPLILGAKGSPLELVLNTLYFRNEYPDPIEYRNALEVGESNLARAIPMYVRFRAQNAPVVGTTLEYFAFRDLAVAEGRQLAQLGECVLGSRVAGRLGLEPGASLLTSPESVFDLAGIYPLKMRVVGILQYSDSPDDDAVFVDLKTAWIIQGLGHGHQDLSEPDAAASVLSKSGNKIVANASVVQYNEITLENLDSFHFHGDLATNPITAVIALPADEKSSALLQGRYQGPEGQTQITVPNRVMGDLLATILTVEKFVVAGAVIIGLATASTATLVFMLSLRLRRRERETLFKIGGSRSRIGSLMASEIVGVLAMAVVLAGGLTLLTAQLGAIAIRAFIRA